MSIAPGALYRQLLCGAVCAALLCSGDVLALDSGVLKGRITDAAGRPAEGVVVSLYNSPDTKRVAEFISAPTEKDGRYRVDASPGNYWVVARLKKTRVDGPLMPGDKHSGEPVEAEVAPGGEITMDFTVADLKEAAKVRTKEGEGLVRISGRIIDEKGAPVKEAYAIANKNGKTSGIPDYLSAWVDREGRYILHLPKGRYSIGGAVMFPPGKDYFVKGEMTVEADRSDVDIIGKSPEK